jgi:hypothetical protein
MEAIGTRLHTKKRDTYRNDGKGGVVFVMNATSVEDKNQVLEGLPLHQAKLVTFELIPLGPLSPLQVFLEERSAEHALAISG